MPRFLPGKWKMTTLQNDLKTSFTSKLVFMFWKLFFSAMKQAVVYCQKGRDENFENQAFFQQKSPPPQWIYFGLPIWISFGGGHAGAAGGATMEHRTLTCKDDVHKLHKELYICIEYIDLWYPPPPPKKKKTVCIQNHPR